MCAFFAQEVKLKDNGWKENGKLWGKKLPLYKTWKTIEIIIKTFLRKITDATARLSHLYKRNVYNISE